MNDGKVGRKGNFGYLVEGRKGEGKKSVRKKMKWTHQFFFPPQIGEKMNKTSCWSIITYLPFRTKQYI